MINKALLPALALSVAAGSVAIPAAAQVRAPAYHNAGPWQSVNQRQARLDHRIDVGLRNGQLSRREATRVRAEFNGLLRLENQYRRGGLTAWERADLDRRFDRLSASIRYERRDRDNRRG